MWINHFIRGCVLVALLTLCHPVQSGESNREIINDLENILLEKLEAAKSDPVFANLPYKIEMNFVLPSTSNNYYSYRELELYLYWVYIMINEFQSYAHTAAEVLNNLAEAFERNRKEFLDFLDRYRSLAPDVCNAVKDSVIQRSVTVGVSNRNKVYIWELEDFINDHEAYILNRLGEKDGGKCMQPFKDEVLKLKENAL